MKGQDLVTEGAEIFHEYLMRQRMATLGYHSPLSELSAFKADCFYIIETSIEETRRKMQEAKRGRRK